MSIAALFVFACGPGPDPAAPGRAWEPIDGTPTTPWEETLPLCAPLLVEGQIALLRAADPVLEIDVRGPYDSCMTHQGWRPRGGADTEIATQLGREVDDFLDREIAPRGTEAELSALLGEPECRGVDAVTEACVWEFDYRSEVAGRPFASVLTCLLPADGAPRSSGSCQLDAR